MAKETNSLFSDKEPLRSQAIKEKSYFKIGILKQHSQNFTSVTVGEYLKDEHHKGWSELEGTLNRNIKHKIEPHLLLSKAKRVKCL